MLHHMLRAAAQRAFSVLDPYFQYVTMLLHGDGTNGAQNNTFLDSSTNNFTITRNGNTTQGTFTPYGSNWSNYFNGSSYITLSSAPISATGAFTFECWVFVTGTATSQNIYGQYTGADAGRFGIFWNDVANKFTFSIATGSYDSASTYAANAWYHIAWVRDGSNNLSLYVNGVRDFTTTGVSTSLSTSNPIIAARAAGAVPYTGYISNLRITNTAVYSGTSFTVPTTPLTNISGTTLLTCQSNRFVDNETTPLTFTISGSPSVQRFSPFSPTTAYSTSVIGGSGYFDGTGDYLSYSQTSALNAGTGNFTVECWVYHLTSGALQGYLYNSNGGTGGGINFRRTSSNTLQLSHDAVADVLTTTATIPINAWTHVAVTRSSGTVRLFINGVVDATTTYTGNFTNTPATGTIGAINGSYTWNGYMTDMRYVVGTAVYTSAFTPPTAPLTAVTNTQLLTNFTNAGILDNAMMNDLETVGNAQISTSVKKYGTGSMYFDRNGDYLSTPTSPNYQFGSGDLTIEMWFYQLSRPAGQYDSLFRLNGAGTGPSADMYMAIGAGASGYAFLVGNNARSGYSVNINPTGGLPSLNAWHHLAIVRSGSTWTVYLDGTSVGTATYSGTVNTPTGPFQIGWSGTSDSYWDGYIDDLRITKGVARYTANFTPPTAAFPNN